MDKEHFNILLELCKSRKSCRKFGQEEIDKDTLKKIVEIARTSPFASGRKNWDILVIDDKNIIDAMANEVEKHIETLIAEINDKNIANIFLNYGKNFSIFRNAPVIFIPYCRYFSTLHAILREKITSDIERWERDNITESLSCASMLILLAAQSLGLGGCYMTGPLIAHNELIKILGINEENIIGSIIPVGIPETLE